MQISLVLLKEDKIGNGTIFNEMLTNKAFQIDFKTRNGNEKWECSR